ncbi:MAG TPA: GerMN domain-containing protein [Candidatus Eremiobacteraceae bacterium]|nr:GerMN domain-containing protein [Candidatus Eremiobacteraceae bacterium]
MANLSDDPANPLIVGIADARGERRIEDATAARPRRHGGEGLIARSSRRLALALTAAAIVVAACSHRTPPLSTVQVAVYYCKAGTDTLVSMPFTLDPHLDRTATEQVLVDQLLAGPAAGDTDLVLFPPGSQAKVALSGDVADVDITGPLARRFYGGESDEVALFKSLTYTATSLQSVTSVQILIGGKIVSTLPGGDFEIDEPLSRASFAQ